MFLAVAACQLETASVEMVEVLRHENGLIVNRPGGFAAQRTATGFTMTKAEAVRSPMTLQIIVVAKGQQPNVAPAWFGLFGVRYRINKSEGGSGGETFILTAMYPLQQCWLVLSASQQAEVVQPTFLEAWAVLDHASAGQELRCSH
jgi:hypothetical protein